MNKFYGFLLMLISMSISSTLQAQGVFDANIHTALPVGSVSSPAAEGPQNIIDGDSSTKFLDFNATDGIAFEVDLLGAMATATSMQFVTANDAPERDPMNYTISGSLDGITYDIVAQGEIPCVQDRFLSRTFAFDNSTAYTVYRVEFTDNCSPSNILQIADVQLFQVIGEAPEFDCPPNISIGNQMGSCIGIAEYSISVQDAEDGELLAELVSGLESGEAFPVGITPVVYNAIDSDGNIVSCSFTVEVQDFEAPQIICPDDVTIVVDQNETSATVDYELTIIENCAPVNPIEGFIPLGTIGNKSYHLSTTFFTPIDALVDSEDQDGFLATIRSQSDNDMITSAILAYAGNIEAIIGYTDFDEEGVFLWFSEDPATYNNWNDGEPNDALAGEDFTIITPNGQWNDVNESSTTYPYILEVDYEPLQTAGLASGDDFPLGTTTNTFEVFDLEGNEGTCSFNVTVTNTSSIENELLAKAIRLSPNPVDQQLTINLSELLPGLRMKIYDTKGVEMFRKSTIDNREIIDLDHLSSGLYIVKFHWEDKIVTRKFVKN